MYSNLFNISAWNSGASYEKNDITYLIISGTPFNFYARETNTNISPTGTSGIYYWTSGFNWVPSYSTALNLEPRVINAQFNNGYSRKQKDGINSTLGRFNVVFENRDDKESKAILHFLEQRAGVEAFFMNIASMYKTGNKYIADEIKHTFKSFNNNDISFSAEQIPHFDTYSPLLEIPSSPSIPPPEESVFLDPSIKVVALEPTYDGSSGRNTYYDYWTGPSDYVDDMYTGILNNTIISNAISYDVNDYISIVENNPSYFSSISSDTTTGDWYMIFKTSFTDFSSWSFGAPISYPYETFDPWAPPPPISQPWNYRSHVPGTDFLDVLFNISVKNNNSYPIDLEMTIPNNIFIDIYDRYAPTPEDDHLRIRRKALYSTGNSELSLPQYFNIPASGVVTLHTKSYGATLSSMHHSRDFLIRFRFSKDSQLKRNIFYQFSENDIRGS